MESIRLHAERFLENRVEPAHDVFERKRERNLCFKDYLIRFLIQFYKCVGAIHKKGIDKYLLNLAFVEYRDETNTNYFHDRQ